MRATETILSEFGPKATFVTSLFLEEFLGFPAPHLTGRHARVPALPVSVLASLERRNCGKDWGTKLAWPGQAAGLATSRGDTGTLARTRGCPQGPYPHLA